MGYVSILLTTRIKSKPYYVQILVARMTIRPVRVFYPMKLLNMLGIFPFQDKLIINYSAPHYGVPSTLCQINLDGTDRNILYTFSSTEIARDPVITDGDNLFFVLDDVNPELRNSYHT